MFIEIEKTPEELAKEQVMAFSRESQSVLDNYKYNYQRLFNMIWSTSVHPQDFFDVLGSNAASIFATAQKVVMHIIDLDPTYTPPSAPYLFTVNPNGTVTVGDKLVQVQDDIGVL